MSITAAAIIPAGGSGLRMGQPLPKQFCNLAGIPILVHTLRAFQQVAAIETIILVAPADYLELAKQLVEDYGLDKVSGVVAGGRLRQDSVRIGLDLVPDHIELVAVHDGARPLIAPEIITECLEQAEKNGAAMVAVPVKDTIKEVGTGRTVTKTVDRSSLWQAQTPQVARTNLLKEAFALAEKDGFIGTDEASLIEHLGHSVTVVNGSEQNIKITRPEDLKIAEALLMKTTEDSSGLQLRIGHGYDAHRLVEGRPLILGGVSIPHTYGLQGHSDADVLTHALCDAILGAVGEGDIGRHFPDSDPKLKGISSLTLLERVIGLAHGRGFALRNADITVIAEKPKLASHFPQMLCNLAKACQVNENALNLKATTTEKMGFAGREEGIAAHAVVMMGPRHQT